MAILLKIIGDFRRRPVSRLTCDEPTTREPGEPQSPWTCPRRQLVSASGGSCWRGTGGTDARSPGVSTGDPYRILVSEVMLQQTQVDRAPPRNHAVAGPLSHD